MLTVVFWKWKPTGSWSHEYKAEHVNAAIRQCEEHLGLPFRPVCVTDDPDGIECRTIPLWNQPVMEVQENKPNCYRRLYAFSEEAREYFGPRFVSIDIDCLMVPGPDGKGITPLLDHRAPFAIASGWQDGKGCCPYNGSMWMMDAGARAQVWNDFDPETSPAEARKNLMPTGKPYFGSDQSWIAHKIPGEKTWTREDGILFYTRHMSHEDNIPNDCRVMFFAGRRKPWSPIMARVHPAIFHEYRKYL